MRFKLDENLPWSISNIMIDYGYDVDTVLTEGLNGCSDDKLINTCTREQRILITLDYDFADILAYPPQIYPGIIVIRNDRKYCRQKQVST
jgi:predicted nuclease of predicted toxin-antitoxin system